MRNSENPWVWFPTALNSRPHSRMNRLDITATDRNVETQVVGEGVWGVSRRAGGGRGEVINRGMRGKST